MNTSYEITVTGYVDDVWSDWFAGLAITHSGQGETTLRGHLVDQAALHGVLAKVRDLGLTLVSVNRIEDGNTRNRSNSISQGQSS